MPDAEGNFKGIQIPSLPWEREDQSIRDLNALADKVDHQRRVEKFGPDTSAWDKARTEALKQHRWAGSE